MINYSMMLFVILARIEMAHINMLYIFYFIQIDQPTSRRPPKTTPTGSSLSLVYMTIYYNNSSITDSSAPTVSDGTFELFGFAWLFD